MHGFYITDDMQTDRTVSTAAATLSLCTLLLCVRACVRFFGSSSSASAVAYGRSSRPPVLLLLLSCHRLFLLFGLLLLARGLAALQGQISRTRGAM